MATIVKNSGDYSVVRTDKMQATKNGSLESARFYVSTTPTTIENGRVVKLDSLLSSERELYKAVAVATVATEEILLVASPEVIYDQSSRSIGLDDFTNAAGADIRLYHFYVGDAFSVSADALDPIDGSTALAVGQYIIPVATAIKLKASATNPGNTRFLGQIIAIETVGVSRPISMVVIRVLKS